METVLLRGYAVDATVEGFSSVMMSNWKRSAQFVTLALVLLWPLEGKGHEGWEWISTIDKSCCGKNDCFRLADPVEYSEGVYYFAINGVSFTWDTQRRTYLSHDHEGNYHWACINFYDMTVRCFFAAQGG